MKKGEKERASAGMLLEEARLQKNALKRLGSWQRNAMLASTCGVALAWWGLGGSGAQFVCGIAGALMTLLGILCAAILGLGIRNGNCNVEKILQAAESRKP